MASMTRSALLAARRAESGGELQAQYDVWADRNPVWAPRVGGPEAAAALGYASGGHSSGPATRSELRLDRKRENLKIAVNSSGFDKDTQDAICANEPGVLITSISRNMPNPSVAWVDKPAFASRTELREDRKKSDRALIDGAMARYARDGHMGAQARSDMRVDQSIQAMFEAGGGETRSGLLASRRSQRMAEVEAAADLAGLAPVPQFAEQETPFWRVGKPGSADGGANSRRAMSREQLQSDRRWFAKPEQYPVVSPAEPRLDDAFKLSQADRRYLARKLSSGPKRAQRGYPPELGALTEKVTLAPAPQLPEPTRAVSAAPGQRAPVRPQRFSEMVFRFLPADERMDADLGPTTDGLQFTRPLYSSFTKSGDFEEPRRHGQRPATGTGGQRGRDHGRPASAQVLTETLRMASLLGQSARGKPPTAGVRCGGFQLLPPDAPSPLSQEMMTRSWRPLSVQ